jgi:Zn-dependent peptidase ImmA (M78 family)
LTQSIPVNNDILKWARETSGLSIAEVARKLKKTVNDIKSWEQGILSPTYPQLEKLAYEIYMRPVAIFFFPAIPQESSPRVEFRTLPEEVVDTMPPEIIKVYKRAKVYQLNLKELENQNKMKSPRLLDNFNLTKDSDIFDITQLIRSFLNIDLKTQISWKNKDEAIDEWRNILITYGIYIFKDAFRNNQFSGFSLYDENHSVIIINNSMPKARQIFTIFHEIAHLLYKAGGVDVLEESFYNRLQSDYYAIEQMCNKFAGEFLFPIAEFKNNRPVFNEENLTKMADTYKVSREVILRKYLDSKLISSEMYKEYTQKWLKEYIDLRKAKKESKSGGDHYNNKKVYLGEYYIKLAFSHYYQGKIDIEILANYLNVKVGNIPTFEGYLLR